MEVFLFQQLTPGVFIYLRSTFNSKTNLTTYLKEIYVSKYHKRIQNSCSFKKNHSIAFYLNFTLKQ